MDRMEHNEYCIVLLYREYVRLCRSYSPLWSIGWCIFNVRCFNRDGTYRRPMLSIWRLLFGCTTG